MNESPKPQKRYQDWNSLNVSLLIQKDQTEFRRMEHFTRSYFVWFFNKDLSLYNDFLLRVLDYAPSYKKEISLFSTWIHRIAEGIKSRGYKREFKQLRQEMKEVSIDGYDFQQEQDESKELDEWRDSLRARVPLLIRQLTAKDQKFLNNYLANWKH